MDVYRGWSSSGFRGSSLYDSPSNCQWPVSSSRLSLLPSRTATATSFSPRTRVLDGEYEEEEEPCRYRGSNMFGRSLNEIFADLDRILSPKAPSGVTPSLVSDSDTTLPSPPSTASPMSYTRDISPDISPPTSPGHPKSNRKQSIAEVEDSLVCAAQALVIRSTSRRLSLDIGSDMEEPPRIQVDAPSPPAEQIRDGSPVPSSPSPSMPLPQMLGLQSTMQQLLEAAELHRPSTFSVMPAKEPSEEEEYRAEKISTPLPSLSMRPITPDLPATPLEPHHGKQPKQPKKPKGAFACPKCAEPKTFTRNYDLQRHITSVHETQSTAAARALTCPVCYQTLSRRDAFRRHFLKVPASCVRLAKLCGKDWEAPLKQPESLHKQCREGKPPLPEMPITVMHSA